MTILAIIGQSSLYKLIQVGICGDPDASVRPAAPGEPNASRISDLTGIPRQTVRRKLEELAARGWIEQDRRTKAWHIATSEAGARARANLRDLEQRSIVRTGRLIHDFNELVAADAIRNPGALLRADDDNRLRPLASRDAPQILAAYEVAVNYQAQGINTIAGIISKYAPPNENNDRGTRSRWPSQETGKGEGLMSRTLLRRLEKVEASVSGHGGCGIELSRASLSQWDSAVGATHASLSVVSLTQ